MKNWIISNKLALIGAFVGGIAGYIYYWQVGCVTGSCAITSKPVNSTVYFAVMGAMAFSIAKPEKKKDSDVPQEPAA